MAWVTYTPTDPEWSTVFADDRIAGPYGSKDSKSITVFNTEISFGGPPVKLVKVDGLKGEIWTLYTEDGVQFKLAVNMKVAKQTGLDMEENAIMYNQTWYVKNWNVFLKKQPEESNRHMYITIVVSILFLLVLTGVFMYNVPAAEPQSVTVTESVTISETGVDG